MGLAVTENPTCIHKKPIIYLYGPNFPATTRMFSRAPLVIAALLLLTGSLAGCTGDGAQGANAAPTADLKVTPAGDGRTFRLDASASKDPDGDALTYAFDWGLGQTTGPNATIDVEFTPAAASGNASYTITLVVRDEGGLNGVAFGQAAFGTGANAAPMIVAKPANRWVAPNVGVLIDASDSMDPDGDGLTYEWIWGPRNGYDKSPDAVPDACGQSDRTLAVFTTGCLNQDQSFSLVFDQAGTYNYHCHPHPWMKGRLIVDPDAPATPNATIRIQDFNYHQETLTVGLGSNVTFVNADVAPHTATIEDYTPGTLPAGSEPFFDQNMTEGEYIARLILTDGKGGRASQTWGIKVGADAPQSPEVTAFEYGTSSTPPDPAKAKVPLAQSQTNSDFQFTLSHESMIQATLKVPENQGQAELELGRMDPDGTFTPISTCEGRRGSGGLDYPANEIRMLCTVPANNYAFRVEVTSGAITSYSIELTTTPYAKPGFGDSAPGGDGHDHQH